MSDLIRINTNYNPKIEVLKEIKLPIEIKNHKGETIASIQYWDSFRTGYHAFVDDKHLYENGHANLIDCLQVTFSYLYQQMQEYRKECEHYEQLKKALRDALKTPWNNL